MTSRQDHAAVLRHADLFGRPAEDVIECLEVYAGVLEKWQAAQNLVSRETLPDMWIRHFADSLQLLPLLLAEDRRVVDLGSGAGFPALPLAIASGATRSFTLLEPNQRKVAFLRAVARETGVKARIEALRVEQFDSRETFDVVTSRAMAPLVELLGLAERLLTPPARGLFHKGREHLREIDAAALLFEFDVVVTPSVLDSESVIVEITRLRRKLR